MAKALSNIPCVEPFIIEETSVNLDKKWIVWKDDLELLLTASGNTQEAQKKALILHCGGRDLREVYRTLKADTDTYADVIQKLDTYFKPKNKHQAIGKICYECGKKNHLSAVCLSSKHGQNYQRHHRDFNCDRTRKRGNQVQENASNSSISEEESENEHSLFSVENNKVLNSVTNCAKILVENVPIKLMIDTGCTTSVIDRETFSKLESKNLNVVLKSSKTKLYPYASQPVKVVGKFNALFETKKQMCSSVICVIDKQKAGNLLGIDTAKQLKLVTIANEISTNEKIRNHHTENQNVVPNIPQEIKTLINDFNECFHGTGTMKDYECKLHVKPDVQPIYQRMRSYHIHLQKQIDSEIIRLEEAGIIESVERPQEWVSNLVATPKSYNSVRLCLDARSINTAIQRETHPIPTLESILDGMHGSKIFSKIDMKEAHTQIMLEEESRKLTNFHTSFGIKRFKRLCYGLNNAFEVFQRSLDQTIGKLRNVKCISDDTIVYNKNYAEHLETLKDLFTKIKELGLR
ncbi:uncharacterized protein K02A2.6-like [Hydractinia symbiolongicarpus]|uniref:uncharacterized protein K02A2.6-like n=2 Tax=Hydractinia symbiolongicarpus TaxID=13093 RepID=UPI0025516D6C|nr:uncharacterized protein K02A2.6-like [Hydractinia symbiolongicarpus]